MKATMSSRKKKVRMKPVERRRNKAKISCELRYWMDFNKEEEEGMFLGKKNYMLLLLLLKSVLFFNKYP